MDSEKQEIQKAESQAIQQVQHEPIPADAPLMIRVAMMMERGIDIDTAQMEKMLDIAERLKAAEAKAAYSADFAIAQANIRPVVKTKWNPQTKSNYEDLGSVIEMVGPVYTAQGFSVVFYEGKAEKPDDIRVCADVLHRDGHKETYHYDVPLGGKGIAGKVNMIDIHAKATSVTYGQRYLLRMIWNIPTKDTDGNPPQQPTPPPAVRPLSTTELEVIDAICEKLPPAGSGYVLNKGHITAILMEKARDYLIYDKVEFCAGQLMDKYAKELHEPCKSVDEQPGTFED